MTRSYAPLGVALLLVTVGVVLLRLNHQSTSVEQVGRAGAARCSQVATAFRQHSDSIWLTMAGKVRRILPDEYGQFQHQRFIVSCASGQTVLIVNDVSVGQRVPVQSGDTVAVRGQYVWNAEGGLIHFTHHSGGGGQGGWILFRNRLYSLGSLTLRPAD